jgi:DsbC/DsbD-like thiol-disulfide interchange protein
MVTRTLRLAALVLLAGLVCEVGLSTSLAQPKKPRKSEDVVKITATSSKPGADGTQLVTVNVAIDKGWHLYANPVDNNDYKEIETTLLFTGKTKPEVLKIEYPAGKLVKDTTVGNYKTYEDTVAIKAHIKRASGDTGPLEMGLKIQACSDSFCLQTTTVKFTAP